MNRLKYTYHAVPSLFPSAVPLGDGVSPGTFFLFRVHPLLFPDLYRMYEVKYQVHAVLETSGESAESVKTNYSALAFQLGCSAGGNERPGKDIHGGASATKDPGKLSLTHCSITEEQSIRGIVPRNGTEVGEESSRRNYKAVTYPCHPPEFRSQSSERILDHLLQSHLQTNARHSNSH